MKFTRDMLHAACRQVSMQQLPDDIFTAMCEIAYRKITTTRWTHGQTAAVFIRTDLHAYAMPTECGGTMIWLKKDGFDEEIIMSATFALYG